jgi:hypothetical protein
MPFRHRSPNWIAIWPLTAPVKMGEWKYESITSIRWMVHSLRALLAPCAFGVDSLSRRVACVLAVAAPRHHDRRGVRLS